MPATKDNPILRCYNIRVSARGIAETHASKIVLFVSSADIDHIIVKFGRSDHRPIVSNFFGAIFSLIGIYGLISLMLNPAGLRYELGMLVLGAIGGTIIFDTVKKRYFLEIHKKKDICRLVFSKKAQSKDIQDFCDEIREAYKYQIKEDVSTTSN